MLARYCVPVVATVGLCLGPTACVEGPVLFWNDTEGNVGGSDGLERVPVFAGAGYGGRRMASFDQGQSWINDQYDNVMGENDETLLQGLCYGADRFVAVGGGNGTTRLLTSVDGETWNPVDLEVGRLQDCILNPAVVYAIGNLLVFMRHQSNGYGTIGFLRSMTICRDL